MGKECDRREAVLAVILQLLGNATLRQLDDINSLLIHMLED